MDLWVEFRFSAAHRLPDYVGRCFRMHGHSYRLALCVTGSPDPHTGMVIDFHRVEDAARASIQQIDGGCWNDLLRNPTAEAIVCWFWGRLHLAIPNLAELRLWETDSCYVAYRGEPVPDSLLAAGEGGPYPDTSPHDGEVADSGPSR